MTTKPGPLTETSPDDAGDELPSASARFRLKMNAFGDLVPEIVPIDEDELKKPKAESA